MLLQLFLISTLKGPLFLLKKSLYVCIDPGFIIGETPYSPGGYRVLHTEIDIVRDAVSESVNVFPMRITVDSKQSLRASSVTSDHLASHGWLPVHEGFVHRPEMNQVVVWSGVELYASMVLA